MTIFRQMDVKQIYLYVQINNWMKQIAVVIHSRLPMEIIALHDKEWVRRKDMKIRYNHVSG